MNRAMDRPGLVFLHGATLNAGMWEPVAAKFRRDYPVAVPDLPGHGRRAAEPFAMATAVATVEATVADLEVSGVVLIGDSLGSYVAIATASRLGARFKGAVLGGATARFHGVIPFGQVLRGALISLFGSRFFRPWLEDKVANDFQAGRAAVAGGIRTEAFQEAVRELRAIDFTRLLREIRAPLLFVNGVSDRPHRSGEARSLAAAPRARLVVMPQVGHGVSLRRPAEFAALVAEFLGSLPN